MMKITDDMIDNIVILSKLELTHNEKEKAKEDMDKMLSFIDKMNELDTESVEPLSHVFPINNVFREDEIVNQDNSEAMIKNAPEQEMGYYKVPKTVN